MALKFVRSTICTNLGEAKTGFCEVARHAWREGEKKRPSERDFIATARYTETGPPYEVTVANSNGTLIWAGSNVNTPGTFCANATDCGYLFLWAEALTACPEGWRLPTIQECDDLIGYTGEGQGNGKPDGPYTTNSWVGSQSSGSYKAVTKAVNGAAAGQELYFPSAGYGTSTGPASSYPTYVYYWTSTEFPSAPTVAYCMRSHPGTFMTSNEYKTYALSVRCVRTP